MRKLARFKKPLRLALFWSLCLMGAAAATAQTAGSGAAATRSESAFKALLDSKLMGRQVPYNVLLPEDYGAESKKEIRYPVIYLLHGLFGHFDNWANNTDLASHSRNYNFIIVMPEGGDGWYTDSATVPADRYESYIIQELIPEVDKKYRTKAARESRAVAGLSMGGYGALKFGLKYAELFSLAGSFSGALGITGITDKNAEAWVSKSVMNVYGDAENETRRNNDIFKMVREMPAEKIKGLPFIYLDCGTEDFLIQSNREFLGLLTEKKVPHEFRELPGNHDWKFWGSQVQEFLRLSERIIKK